MPGKATEFQFDCPIDLKLARAYIPFQNYGARYEPRQALERGTIFVDLYRPYKRRRI